MTDLQRDSLDAISRLPESWIDVDTVATFCGCEPGSARNALRMMCVHGFAKRNKGDVYRITAAGLNALKGVETT